MKEFEEAVVEAFRGMAESGKIEEIIRKSLDDTVKRVIERALATYSPFGEKLGEYLEEALRVDLGNLGLAGYNDTVLKIVGELLDTQMGVAGRAALKEDLGKILKAPPEEIKLSELVEEMKRDHSEWHDVDGGECTCVVEWTGSVEGYAQIYMDAEHQRERRSCAYHLSTSRDGKVYALSINDSKPGQRLFYGRGYGFARYLFALHAAHTKLIIDEDDVIRDYGSEG